MQLLPLTYVYIPGLDYPIYTLLAIGYFGFGAVPNLLATYITFQVTRYSSGRYFWFTKGHHHLTRQVATAVAPGISRRLPQLSSFHRIVD
ncbi:MAG: hypothetical protein ABI594_18770 [Ginsengibacter sp.]